MDVRRILNTVVGRRQTNCATPQSVLWLWPKIDCRQMISVVVIHV
jgi:hypothetical protein